MSSSPVTTPSSSTSSVGAITNQSDFNASYTQFLQMLTTELQNQDPTSPMDATQFTNQLVGFSQLEQQLQTNAQLGTLVADQQANTLGSALSYLNHNVLASGDALELDGKASTSINYSLPSTASSATMTVTNSAGTVVSTVSVPTAEGRNTVSFGGSADLGTGLPAGDYTYAVTATDASGNAITATTYTTGTVSAIDTSTGSAVLHLGDLLVEATSVVEVLS